MKAKYLLSFILALIIIAAAIFVAIQNIPFSDIVQEEKISEDDIPTALGNLTYKEAVNAFAFDLFKELYKTEQGNVFISPYSIFTALAMTYEGAQGKTAEEMKEVLKIEQDNSSFHTYMKNLYDLLNKKDEDYNISTANALWVQQNYKLLDSYLNIISEFYGGDATELNFWDAEESSKIINQWVENKTYGLIKDLIKPSYISPLTTLILTNAIYFKGLWKCQFDPVNTTDRDFKNSQGQTIQTQTMSIVDTKNHFNYTETDDFQILELPYSGDDLSMMILLPKDIDFSDAINKIDDTSLEEWKATMYETTLDIYIPKFKVESEFALKDLLIELGMANPFTSLADFSGINGIPELYISEVIHKSYIDVNEEGTEAAAATAVIMERLSINGPEKIVFDCDHPFIYTIQHKETGTILFLGSIDNL
jgi:serpin B